MASIALPDLTARIRVDDKELDQIAVKGNKIGDKLRKGLALGAAAAGAALGTFALKGVQGASDLEQALGGVDSVFGKSAKTVVGFADQAAKSVGLAKDEYATLAAVVGSQLQRMGQSQEESAKSTDKLIGLGADLAATFGGSVSEAVSAVGALLRGEADPIERYGVGIKETDVAARLAATGQDKLKGASLEQAKAQAKLAILFEQTKNAQGAFGRESGTAAGQQAILKAQVRDLQTEMGTKLLPVLSTGLTKLLQLVDYVERNQRVIVPLVGVLGGLALGITAVNAAAKAYTATQAALNVVLALNPIGIVVLALAALTAGVILAYKKSETFRDVVKTALEAVRGAFVALATGALGVVDKLLAGYQALATAAGKLPGPLGAPFRAAADAIGGVRDKVGALKVGIESLKGKEVKVEAETRGAVSDINSVGAAAARLRDKTITITTIERRVIESEANRDANRGRNAVGQRAGGGPVYAGRPYLVGEREPELFVPRVSGQILNQRQLASAAVGAGAVYNVTINRYGGSGDGSDVVGALQRWELLSA